MFYDPLKHPCCNFMPMRCVNEVSAVFQGRPTAGAALYCVRTPSWSSVSNYRSRGRRVSDESHIRFY